MIGPVNGSAANPLDQYGGRRIKVVPVPPAYYLRILCAAEGTLITILDNEVPREAKILDIGFDNQKALVLLLEHPSFPVHFASVKGEVPMINPPNFSVQVPEQKEVEDATQAIHHLAGSG